MSRLVPEIEGDNEWNSLLEQLEGEVEISLQIGGIDHIDDEIPVSQHLDGHLFSFAGGIERVGSGDVHNLHPFIAQLHVSSRILNRRPRII